jgi:hypothetical protein
MPSMPAPLSNNPMGAMNGVKEGDQGLNKVMGKMGLQVKMGSVSMCVCVFRG